MTQTPELQIRRSSLSIAQWSHPLYHTQCGNVVAFAQTTNPNPQDVIGDDGRICLRDDYGRVTNIDVPLIPCQHCNYMLVNGGLTTEGELPR